MHVKCPNCGNGLDKTPSRKTRCKTCGQFIYVKYTPDNRVRRLMTEAEAIEAEAAWKSHHDASKIAREAEQFHLPSWVTRDELVQALKMLADANTSSESNKGWPVSREKSPGESRVWSHITSGKLSKSEGEFLHLRKMAAHLLSQEYSESPEERCLWAKASCDFEIDCIAFGGASDKVQISVPSGACESCRSLIGVVFDTAEAKRLAPLPNLECTEWTQGRPCCAFWSAYLPGWKSCL